MRTIVTLFAFTILFNANAQEPANQEIKQQFTPEQIAELQTKKMELEFELNDKQRKEMYELNRELAVKRQQNLEEMKVRKAEHKALSSDEKYQKQLQKLDEQKKHQTEMKRILGEEKYKTWKENHKEQRMNRQKPMQKNRAALRTKRKAPKIN